MSDSANKAQGPGSAVNPDDAAEPQDFEVDGACDTLMKAEEIKANDKLMHHVQKKLAKRHGYITSLKDVKARSAALDAEEYES